MRSSSEDIGQAALVRLLGHERRGISLVTSPAYVRRVAHNAVVDAMRSHARRESLHRTHHAQADTDASVLERDHLLARVIDEHLERLGDDRRRAVSLYLEGARIREIAASLGWGEKKTSNAVFRGLARLRRELAATGLGPATDA